MLSQVGLHGAGRVGITSRAPCWVAFAVQGGGPSILKLFRGGVPSSNSRAAQVRRATTRGNNNSNCYSLSKWSIYSSKLSDRLECTRVVLKEKNYTLLASAAKIAQSGERQTEDLKVPGSISSTKHNENPGFRTFWDSVLISVGEMMYFCAHNIMHTGVWGYVCAVGPTGLFLLFPLFLKKIFFSSPSRIRSPVLAERGTITKI